MCVHVQVEKTEDTSWLLVSMTCPFSRSTEAIYRRQTWVLQVPVTLSSCSWLLASPAWYIVWWKECIEASHWDELSGDPQGRLWERHGLAVEHYFRVRRLHLSLFCNCAHQKYGCMCVVVEAEEDSHKEATKMRDGIKGEGYVTRAHRGLTWQPSDELQLFQHHGDISDGCLSLSYGRNICGRRLPNGVARVFQLAS